jgi:hypothetical protein
MTPGVTPNAAPTAPRGGPPSPRPQGVTIDEVAARATHTATALADGSVFVAGGCIVDGCSLATGETFVLEADRSSVRRGPTLARPRDGHTATLVHGTDVVLAGGFPGEGGGVLGEVEVYRRSTGAVDASGTLEVPRGGHAAAGLPEGEVLVAGGWIRRRTYTATAEVIDPRSGTVRRAADMPVAADALDAATLADGRVLVAGGQTAPGVATRAATVYDPGSDTWSPVGPMLTARFKHALVPLPDGRVLVIGGTTDDTTLLATTEVFDPDTGRFDPGPTLTEPRYKLTGGALVLPDGRVVVAGGGRSVEVIDVGSGTTSVVAELGSQASFATISPWAGSLVVLGGYDDRIDLRREHVLVGIPPA